jgi:hypothetical protein
MHGVFIGRMGGAAETVKVFDFYLIVGVAKP